MELLDCLSNEDKTTIEEFIISYADCTPKDLETVLYQWNKNKRTMYKALGKQLRVKIPIDLELDNQLFYHKLTEIYSPLCIEDINLKDQETNHIFIQDLTLFLLDLYEKVVFPVYNKQEIQSLFSYCAIEKGTVLHDIKLFNYEDDKELKIPKGMKIIKAIQKMLKFYHYNNMELFEQWRNALSNLSVVKKIKANLVFSIHPIDFLTMSDNNCGWQSCMSWMKKGGYSAGVIEMLNSNMVILCYLESNKLFTFNGHKIPNKSWRALCYLHKDILLIGKPYPYYNEQVSLKVLDELKKLVKKNLNWKYQYSNQEYKDLKHYNDNWYVRTELSIKQRSLQVNCKNDSRHSILLYTYGMYNDIIEDKGSKYWCCRNYIDHTLKICVSGKATCMACGEPLDTNFDLRECTDDNLQSHSCQKYCRGCEEKHWCSYCHQINDKKKYILPIFNALPQQVCESCLNDFFYVPSKNVFIYKNKFMNHRLFHDNEISRNELISAKEVSNIEEYSVSNSI